MTDEIRQTPVPVPHVYGQPAASPALAGQQATETITTTTATPPTATGDTPAPTIEQAAASPAPTTTEPAATTTTTFNNNNNNNAPSPSPAAAASAPARTGTPLRTTNANANGNQPQDTSSSRAASQHPDPGFTMPSEAPPHGAPVRQYLNSKVTGPLLDGMKMIAKEQPKDPLRALGEYLLQRSKELESTS
ncbi:uncharacterized protein F4812DRAFT_421866 [Daldinia caldariorum]|uniref:uncharacterized protein n=1 Tax=Daldinia caldariorum TaxID=326644 RepID=UPI002008C96B|nr:uncharacterized protein F4812DRAFT_421866 [Daldinia caldariorum]KAI1470203.1 hypothetical protein F4812DRAFT_421866 [Daldinia caldariorum]